MKYELDTIPVWDAIKLNTECPLCYLENRSRSGALRYYVGHSVMVPEVRVSVNENGFSKENAFLLSQSANRQGLSLIFHTRLKEIRSQLFKKLDKLLQTSKKFQDKSGLMNFVAPKTDLEKSYSEVKSYLDKMNIQCLIEKKVNQDLGRYLYTLVHLWLKDSEFRVAFNQSKGPCLNHFPLLLKQGLQDLSPSEIGTFFIELVKLSEENLDRVENDLLTFTKTFDSTKSHDLNGNPDKAIERTLQKIYGLFPTWEEDVKRR